MMDIETDRLVLRNFRAEDAADLFAYMQHPVASCFLSDRLEDMAAAIKEADMRRQSDEQLAVCLKESGAVIGDVFAMAEEDTFSVGWNFNPVYSGRGFAFEAGKALFDHLFHSRNARRLYAYVEDHNGPSQRLCERLGMRKEGTFVEYVSFQTDDSGQPVYENTMQFAILKKEWLSRSA